MSERNATAAAAAREESNFKHLKGKYLEFFAPPAYETVERWYNTVATATEREHLKQLITSILAFDFAKTKKTKLRITDEPDIYTASAIVALQNGDKLLSQSAKQKAVEYLTFASVPERNTYRNVFGKIIPPSTFTAHRQYNDDFVPSKKFTRGEASLVSCRTLIGKEHIQLPSVAIVAPANIKPVDYTAKTQQALAFPWKAPLARSSGDAVVRKACESTFCDAPYGLLDCGNVDGRQWRSVTNEIYHDSFFLQDKNKRAYQNYNENYTHVLYTLARQQRTKKDNARSLSSGAATEENHNTTTTLPALREE